MKSLKIKVFSKAIFFILSPSNSDDENITLYWTTEMKCRKTTKQFACFGLILQVSIFSALISGLFNIYMGDSDPSTWSLPFMIVSPFDTNSILGWFLTWFYEFNMSVMYFTYLFTTCSHFLCCCYYIIAICDHFSTIIHSIKVRKEKNIQNNQQRCDDALEKLNRAIETHNNVYE